MVERIHSDIVEPFPFFVGVPTFPNGCRPVFDHVSPRRVFCPVQQSEGAGGFPKLRQDVEKMLRGMEAGCQMAELVKFPEEVAFRFFRGDEAESVRKNVCALRVPFDFAVFVKI